MRSSHFDLTFIHSLSSIDLTVIHSVAQFDLTVIQDLLYALPEGIAIANFSTSSQLFQDTIKIYFSAFFTELKMNLNLSYYRRLLMSVLRSVF